MPEATAAFTIRPVEPSDGPTLWRLREAAWSAGELKGDDEQTEESWTTRTVDSASGALVAERDGSVVGGIMPEFHQVFVDETHRRHGVGTALLRACEANQRGWRPLTIWLPEGNVGARLFLESAGYSYHSSLWEMRLQPPATVPAATFGRDVSAAPFHSGDEDAFVALFNAAFSDHASPLQISRAIVDRTHAEPGFDPEDILLLRSTHPTGELVGLARVRVGNGVVAEPGEVSFIALAPEWRGRGLGRELLQWAVIRLRSKGANVITLRVEALNAGAISLYESTGFRTTHEWRRWSPGTQ